MLSIENLYYQGYSAVKIYLIRHAQSEENVLNLRQRTAVQEFNQMLCCTHSTPLTRLGRFQAKLTTGRLEQSSIERIYTSPFDRAIQTAKIIGREIGIIPQVVNDLREVQPQLLKERKRDASLRKHLFRSCVGMVLPGGDGTGEKLSSSYHRAKSVWSQLTADSAQEIAIVSHYGLISLMIAFLDRDSRWKVVNRDLSNGGITTVVRRRSIAA